MKVLIVAIVLAVLALGVTMYTRAEAGCYQFATWEQAQAAHQQNPWLGLDADGNGIACDCLLQGFPC